MAEIAPGIVGVAIKAEQLSPLLADAFDASPSPAGGDGDSREVNPMARSVKVLSILIRELAEAFDNRDSMYPRGMKHCARLVLEDCNSLCDELRALVSAPPNADGEPNGITKLSKAKLDQLQTEIDLQKAMLVAITSLASFTRQVIYTRYAAKLFPTKTCQSSLLTWTALSDTNDSPGARDRNIEQKRAEVEVAIGKAIQWDKMRILQEDMEGNQQSTVAGDNSRPHTPVKRASFAPLPGEEGYPDGRQSPRSFQSNRTLQNILTYWRELQDMSMAEPPHPHPHRDNEEEEQRRDEGWEDLGDGIQRYESRDIGTQDDREPGRFAATAMDEDDAPRHWLPRSPPRDVSPSMKQPSPKHHHPGALRSLVRTARTPSPHYDSQEERNMPPSPPYSAGSQGDDVQNTRNVHHHHHIHHHEHHHTSHRRRHHSQTPPLQTPQQQHAVTDREHGRPLDMADEFWNVIQANGGIHWELRKKRGDRLIVREFTGPELTSQGETSWTHLTVSGSVWTSVPRKFCSRSILLDLPYDFKEDEQYFHIIEELEYVSCSLILYPFEQPY